MNIERGLAIISGFGLIAALFTPVHRAPNAVEPGLIGADTTITIVNFYPGVAIGLALIAALCIGLAATGRLKAIVGPGLAALSVLELLVWSLLKARAADTSGICDLRPQGYC